MSEGEPLVPPVFVGHVPDDDEFADPAVEVIGERFGLNLHVPPAAVDVNR